MTASPTSTLPEDSRISVVIPVKNEAAGIAACLSGILRQRRAVDEIIVIDSGSTDGTQDIVRQFEKTRLVEIAPTEFNHGDTRNLGVRESSGDIVVFTVGDARPVDDGWLDALLAGFVADDIAAVSGAQVVPHEARTNPVEWFRPQSAPQIEIIRFNSRETFEAEEPETRRRACALDDVTAAYRREALEAIPFRRIVYGEDVFFALDAYRGGWALAFNPAARVYHYHLESPATVLKRTISVAALRYSIFGCQPEKPTMTRPLLSATKQILKAPGLDWRERLKWLRYNVETRRALRRGVELFQDAAASGGDALENLHQKYCGTPPMPLKPGAGAA